MIGLAKLEPIVLAILSCELIAFEGTPQSEGDLNEVLECAEQERQGTGASFSKGLNLKSGEPLVQAVCPMRPKVGHFVRYFQGPGAQQFRAALKRLQSLGLMITGVLREEGLPPDLVWSGLVESGLIHLPGHRRTALGTWQLIPQTAKTSGLAIAGRDERTGPQKSTCAAVRYLQYLHASYGHWPLTLVAYNAGEHRAQRAIDRACDWDFWRLVVTGVLPQETQTFMPDVLAAHFLGNDASIRNESIANYGATRCAGVVAVVPFSLAR